jgi:hypothetical protein
MSKLYVTLQKNFIHGEERTPKQYLTAHSCAKITPENHGDPLYAFFA